MTHAHKLNDQLPEPVYGPATAGQIALLIELVRPISELAQLALAQRAAAAEPDDAAK